MVRLAVLKKTQVMMSVLLRVRHGRTYGRAQRSQTRGNRDVGNSPIENGRGRGRRRGRGNACRWGSGNSGRRRGRRVHRGQSQRSVTEISSNTSISQRFTRPPVIGPLTFEDSILSSKWKKEDSSSSVYSFDGPLLGPVRPVDGSTQANEGCCFFE